MINRAVRTQETQAISTEARTLLAKHLATQGVRCVTHQATRNRRSNKAHTATRTINRVVRTREIREISTEARTRRTIHQVTQAVRCVTQQTRTQRNSIQV
jgi:hypothetical protein